MTDAEIDDMVKQIDQMAQRIGCRFTPDPDKLAAFRRAHNTEDAKIRRQFWEFVNSIGR